MKRFGKPIELCGAIVWLASDSSSFVTGSEIVIDGGFMYDNLNIKNSIIITGGNKGIGLEITKSF